MMKAIVAMAENRVIGNAGQIPWHLPEDLKFFKRTTLGHPIVMGRKTYDSIGKPLPGRQNIILSRTMPETQGVTIVRSPEDLLKLENNADFFVIGGAEIYKLLVPYCDELFVTRISREVEGDTYFPEFEEAFDSGEQVFETPYFTVFRHRKKWASK
jgi:dihydrofolate reductase